MCVYVRLYLCVCLCVYVCVCVCVCVCVRARARTTMILDMWLATIWHERLQYFLELCHTLI